MDYASLKSTVLDWLARQDISDTVFESFVTIVEQTISAELKCFDVEDTYAAVPTVDISTGASFIPLPNNFREARVVMVDDKPIYYIEPQKFLTDKYNNGFTIVGNKMLFGGGNSSEHAVTVVYYKRVPHINLVNLKNSIIEKYPNVYLFGCLREAYSYISDIDKSSVMDTRFQRAIEEARFDADTSAYSGSVLTPMAG